MLLILTVARIFVFDQFGQGEVFRLCYVVFITLLIFVPVWKLRAKARNLRSELVDNLKNELIKSQAAGSQSSGTAKPEQIKIVIEEIEKYDKGIYSPHIWFPVLVVLIMISGGVSSPLLMEYFFQ